MIRNKRATIAVKLQPVWLAVIFNDYADIATGCNFKHATERDVGDK